MKKTLLEIVQQILSDLDSENVNSLSDSVEALQIAYIVEQTFYDLIATRDIPEHESLIKLTAASNTDTPTHFTVPTNVKKITDIWYDVSDAGIFSYSELLWVDPKEFLSRVDSRSSDYTNVSDTDAGTNLRITNNRPPSFYTSFNDTTIVLDSHKATIDTTLQESKTRAFGVTYPTFSISATYTPDLDAAMFPLLIQESKSRAFSTLKGGVDQKIEQAARRQKVYVQNDKRKLGLYSKLRNYGR